VNPPASFWSILERRAAETPDALFSLDESGRQLSFAEYRDAALSCAAGLAALGVGRDSAVSWMLPTWTESLVLVAGLSRLGARQNPILPIYRGREVGFIVQQSRARWLVVPRVFRGFDYASMAAEVAREASALEVVVVDPESGDKLPAGDPSALPPLLTEPATPDRAPDTAAVSAPLRWLFYTSGTTADPKGALHTDASLIAAAAGLAEVVALAPDDRVALVFPLTHIGGVGWVLAGLLSGCAQLVVPVFDPATSIPFLAENGVTQATAGTAFHQAYLEAQRARPDAPLFPNVRSFPGGGAPKPPQLHHDVRRELGGVGIVSGYGMTECPIVSMNRVSDPDEKLAHTEGRANPLDMQIRVVKPDGTLASAGEEGEIRARGPQLFRGYLDASLDEAALDDDGFFRTGDLGAVDVDGFVVITGRLKDVIIRKGENISAKEVEDLLHGHPAVAEAAAVGLPDPKTGERCCAVVVCREGQTFGFDEMVEFLAERDVMRQKIPEQLEIIDELPRNPTGKVLKNELRERFSR
jgi:acyl-CoA synthetase (AMP-forming)/AMP-acid ligase II